MDGRILVIELTGVLAPDESEALLATGHRLGAEAPTPFAVLADLRRHHHPKDDRMRKRVAEIMKAYRHKVAGVALCTEELRWRVVGKIVARMAGIPNVRVFPDPEVARAWLQQQLDHWTSPRSD